MAACFSFLKKKKTKNRPEKSQASASASASAPPSTVTTSRSDDSAAGKHISKSSASTSSQLSIPAMYEERAHNLRVFELDELRNVTNDFSRMNKIGEGGFGSVFKGFIRPLDGKGDRIAVAVKKLNQRGLQVQPSIHRVTLFFESPLKECQMELLLLWILFCWCPVIEF